VASGVYYHGSRALTLPCILKPDDSARNFSLIQGI
jgi:hypothetical protein